MSLFRSLSLLCGFVFLTAWPSFGQTTATGSAGSVTAPVAPSSLAASASPADSLTAARRLASTGHGEQALQQLDTLASTSPQLPGLERARGLAYYDLNRLQEANSAFAKALAQDPADAESAQMQGLTLFRLGRPADAIPFLEGAHAQGRGCCCGANICRSRSDLQRRP
jgi:predicted Zn-dependent protease